MFTDTGTTKDGDKLFQFTHRTFLEYFAASHLVRTESTPEALIAALLPKIEKAEWDVVVQLAFQLLNKNVEGAGDSLLQGVLSRAAKSDDTTVWNLLSFTARCLQFLVPSPCVARDVTTAAMNQLMQHGMERRKKKSSRHSRDVEG